MNTFSFINYAHAQTGLEFLGISETTPVGDVFEKLFFFGLGLAGLAALIMLVVGGVMYLTAGDSQDQTKRARAYMTNALWGLVLAFISWLILFTINPDIVQKLDLEIKPLKAPTRQETLSELAAKNFGNVLGETITPINSPSSLETCKSSGGAPAKVTSSTGQFTTSSPAGAYCLTKNAQSFDGKCPKQASFKDFYSGKDLGKFCIK